MMVTNNQLLVCANFLHFFSAGLVAPPLIPHIIATGGNHLVLGILTSSFFLANNVSRKILSFFESGSGSGKKSVIRLCFYFSFIFYMVLAIYYHYFIVCFFRFLYEVTNQISVYSKEYVAKDKKDESSKLKVFHLLDSTKICGIAIGAITGGYIFNYFEDFSTSAMIANICTFLGIVILQYMDEDSPSLQKEENFSLDLSKLYPKIPESASQKWDSILLKCVFIFCFVVYFSKFVFMLVAKYQIGFVIIGYSVAYQIMLKFMCNTFIPLFKEKINKKHFRVILMICGISLNALNFAPSYEIHLIIFIPLIVAHTFANLFLDDVLDLKNKEISEFSDYCCTVVTILGPILFGVLCDIFGGKAFKVFILLPIASQLYYLRQKWFKKTENVDETKSKDD